MSEKDIFLTPLHFEDLLIFRSSAYSIEWKMRELKRLSEEKDVAAMSRFGDQSAT